MIQENRMKGIPPEDSISYLINDIDLGELENKSSSFREFVKMLKSA